MASHLGFHECAPWAASEPQEVHFRGELQRSSEPDADKSLPNRAKSDCKLL